MIPEIHVDALHLGPVVVHPFGLLQAAGVIAAHSALIRLARGLGSAWTVEGFALALGAGGLTLAVAAPSIGLGGLSSVLAWGGAAAAGGVYVAARRLDGLRFADAAAGALPFGWILARGGCALVHDHLGPASGSWLAVAFASGPRLDVGLLEWALTPLLFAAAALGRRWGRRGAVAGAVAVTYAALRFPLDLLRVGDARFGGLTAAQWASLVLAACGVALLVTASGPAGEAPGDPADRGARPVGDERP